MLGAVAELGRGRRQTECPRRGDVGNLANNSQIRNANQAAAMQWFGGAMTGNNSAGALLNNQFGNQIAGQQAAAAQSSSAMSGLGSLAGTLGSAAIFASF